MIVAAVRLGRPGAYDPAEFAAAGVAHHDLPFPDAAAPPAAAVGRFLEVAAAAAAAGGAVGVHCRAGLGRTGTLVGACLVRRYIDTTIICVVIIVLSHRYHYS